ncbi:MAG: LptF/LptG family permease [Alphaproteobacteria bacterium]|nr:LptF/LptG family permease [Alphaproteobacteria bacterium]
MISGFTLARYLARQYLFWFLAFLAVLGGIIYLFEVAELTRRTTDLVDVRLGTILRMGLYKFPNTVETILPFAVLFSSMFSFWRLTRSQELIIARACGISAWQFLAPALMVTLFFGLLHITLLNPLSTIMAVRYQEMETKYLRKGLSLELTEAGLWLRQEEGGRNYLIHADQVSLAPLTLHPVLVFIYDRSNTYLGRMDGQSAVLDDKKKAWIFSNVWFNWDRQEPFFKDSAKIQTGLTLEQIQDSMASPNTISIWMLPHFIRALNSIGLPATRHELKLHALLAEPVLLCAMIFFAAAFSLRLSRRGGVLRAMAAGLVTGGLVFAANNVVGALASAGTLPVFLAAWAIPITALIAGQTTLLYLEDG